MKSRILIVDDNEALVRGLSRMLGRHYDVTGVISGEDALEDLAKNSYDLLLTDLAMPSMDGLELLKQVRALGRTEAVVMMSGSGTIEAAVDAVKLGAADFLEKPVRRERLLQSIKTTLALGKLTAAHERLLAEQEPGDVMLGNSAALDRVRKLISKVAPTEGRVLITGENGTGKELVASSVHKLSRRCEKPFVKLNCSAVPNELIESELFGHKKGAFTGAVTDRKGRFELADGGTLFLDEVGDTPHSMQAKLLRVLQDGTFTPVGSASGKTVDVRVIAATNKDLQQMVDDGEFREDLYYRLNVFPIHMPPLRQRIDDVPLLAQHFADASARRNRNESIGFTDAALRALSEHDYPGNIRQLQNIVERLTILAEDAMISEEDVRTTLPQRRSRTDALPLQSQALLAAGITQTDLERQRLIEAMQKMGGRKAEAAKELGMSRSTLWRKLKQHGITQD